jgi:uncharacterized membrane protein
MGMRIYTLLHGTLLIPRPRHARCTRTGRARRCCAVGTRGTSRASRRSRAHHVCALGSTALTIEGAAIHEQRVLARPLHAVVRAVIPTVFAAFAAVEAHARAATEGLDHADAPSACWHDLDGDARRCTYPAGPSIPARDVLV